MENISMVENRQNSKTAKQQNSNQVLTKKLRDSNLELFRIIVMLLIIAHHYVVNSGLTAAEGPIFADPLSGSSIFLLLFGAWGKIGINCFVLITGYFMCKSHITMKKFCKLLLQVYFYRIVIYGIFILTGYETVSFSGLAKVILPITSISTNFTSCYLIFFLCIPFLNILVQNMKEKQHIALLLICAFTYIVLGTLPKFNVTMNYVSWFIVLYFISSYIRLYSKKIFENTSFWGWMTAASVLVSIASVIACAWLGTKLDKNMAYYFVTDSNTFLAILTGICSFMLFKNIKIKYSKFINTVSASTFGVLLIHANSSTMRQWLWQDTFNNVGMYGSSYMVIHAIGAVLVIYAVCSAIDFLRIRFLENPLFNYYDRHYDSLLLWFEKIENKLFKNLKAH